MSIKRLALGLALAGMSASTFAHGHSGLWYFSGGLGFGSVDQKVTVSSVEKEDKSGFAWAAGFGYNWDETWAIEWSYASYAEQEFTANAKGKNGSSLSLLLKGTMPMSEELSFHGKIGPAMVSYKLEGSDVAATDAFDESNKVGVMLNVGADYNVTEDLDLTLDLNMSTKASKVPAMNSVLLGFTWTLSGM